MSTVSVEVGGKSPGLLLSVSQIFGRLTSCEERWVLDRKHPEARDVTAKSEALDLGTLLHRLQPAWWSGKGWKEEWLQAAQEFVGESEIAWALEDNRLVERKAGWHVPKIFTRAAKIMEAWDEVHGSAPHLDPDPGVLAGGTLVASELPFDLPIPGVTGARIRGFIDGLVSLPTPGARVSDRNVLLEWKSMGRWGREDQVEWDPQLHVYGWAARQMFGVTGAVFEAISTYDYKQGGPERRFKRIHVEFDDRRIEWAMDNVRRAARRAKALAKNPNLAVRNAGEACTYCDHRLRCHTPWEVT